MFPLTSKELTNLKKNDFELLQKLDDNGCFAGVNESFAEFKSRLILEKRELDKFDKKITSGEATEIIDDIKVVKDDLIPLEIINEAGETTQKFYDFRIDYLPGFFLNKDIGLLWGGCSIYDEKSGQRIFLIRKNFKNSHNWFIYDRNELLSHELCHDARQILNDRKLEEFFAYQTSKSALRRYIGNCFISEADALLFVLPPILLLLAQLSQIYIFPNLSIVPFWAFTIGMIIFFFLRNHLARKIFFNASAKIEKFKIEKSSAFLFRCTSSEMAEIAKLNSREEFLLWVNNKAKNELRFQIISRKWKLNE